MTGREERLMNGITGWSKCDRVRSVGLHLIVDRRRVVGSLVARCRRTGLGSDLGTGPLRDSTISTDSIRNACYIARSVQVGFSVRSLGVVPSVDSKGIGLRESTSGGETTDPAGCAKGL